MSTENSEDSANAARFRTEADDVFGRIASRYDVLCDLFSLGLHRLWKRKAAKLIAAASWSQLLDAATGTGDIVLRVARRKALLPHQRIVASDICPQMLSIARRRTANVGPALDFRLLDAHAMPDVPDASVDLYSLSFALKICERPRVLAEAMRVLRPGGRLLVLEASNIRWPWVHRAYLGYMAACVPIIGWLATGGDASAYRYLLKGIQDFPTAQGLCAELMAAGFEDVSFERMSLGIVAIHLARKPGAAPLRQR